jgi:hypothetical protein
VDDFNIPTLKSRWSFRPRNNKEMSALNKTIHQIDIIDIYRILHPIAAEYIFFPVANGTFSK